jgi:hypothetical protein
MITNRVEDSTEILNGVWRSAESLKAMVNIELVCFVNEAISTDVLDQHLNQALQSGQLKINNMKVLYVNEQNQEAEQLYAQFEELVYMNPQEGMKGPDGELIELSPEDKFMVMDAIKSFDVSGMSAIRRVRCNISAKFAESSSVYTEILQEHLNDEEQQFQSLRYFKNQLEQTA